MTTRAAAPDACSLAEDLLARVDEEEKAGGEYRDLARLAWGLGLTKAGGDLFRVGADEWSHASLLASLAVQICPESDRG